MTTPLAVQAEILKLARLRHSRVLGRPLDPSLQTLDDLVGEPGRRVGAERQVQRRL